MTLSTKSSVSLTLLENIALVLENYPIYYWTDYLILSARVSFDSIALLSYDTYSAISLAYYLVSS